jgi:hypothetical protein
MLAKHFCLLLQVVTVLISSVADPGCLSRIPDLNYFHPGSRIRVKEFKYFKFSTPKKWFLCSWKYDPGCSSRIRILTIHSSRIRILTIHPSRIPDPGVKKAPDPDPQHCLLGINTKYECLRSEKERQRDYKKQQLRML